MCILQPHRAGSVMIVIFGPVGEAQNPIPRRIGDVLESKKSQ